MFQIICLAWMIDITKLLKINIANIDANGRRTYYYRWRHIGDRV